MTTLIPGCGSDDADVLSESVAEESELPPGDGPTADVTLPDASVTESFTPPFPENVSFFSPPGIEAAAVAPSESLQGGDQHATVRVIGFSQIGDDEPQALLEIGGSLESVRTGDSINGITVVTVDAPNVTLQQRNDRWTVALFKQPLVRDRSPITARRSPVPDRQTQTSAGTLAVSGNSYDSRSRKTQLTGAANVGLPPDPKASPLSDLPVALPGDLDLPELPMVSDLDLPAEEALPGIDALPQLPAL